MRPVSRATRPGRQAGLVNSRPGLFDALVDDRAVAVGMAFGPAAGLELLDAVRDEPALRAYHLLPSVRGEFLVRLDRPAEAEAEFRRAAALTRNERERTLLLARAAACAEVGSRLN